MNEKERLAQALRDGDMETFTKAIREANAPERLAQRDRLAKVLHDAEIGCTETMVELFGDNHNGAAARLIDAHVRVGPDEGLRVINAEIARRESPEYQRFAEPSENQPPANRVGQAAARAQQHGELVGLKLARHLLEGSAE